jgi:hypothetical protein
MKNLTKIIGSIIIAVMLASCKTLPWGSLVSTTNVVAVGTSSALRFAIHDPARRTVIANYIDVYAVALRTVSGDPTDEQLLALINQFVPANIRSEYPELVTLVTPVIIAAYRLAPKYATLENIAAGLELGAAPFISHQ